MKKTPMQSLQAFQTNPVIVAKPKQPTQRKITVRTKVVLTHGVLYRTLGDKLVRPGHKMIPPGTIGTVTAVHDDERQFDVEFRAPVVGTLSVTAPEITAWEKPSA